MIEIHDGASVRNLERIQETGPNGASNGSGNGRGVTLALVVVSGVCIVFAGLAFSSRKTTTPQTNKVDPLAGLASNHATVSTVMPGEVTFPGLLSDAQHPTSPLAANAATATTATFVAPDPPPPGDRLLVVPLPAKHTLTGMNLARPAKDKLSVLADDALDPVSKGATLAGPGSEGGYQVQVSSFRTEAEADAFANQLRARGHKAHVQRAEIPSRGTWYRVKIGPFTTIGEATRYRIAFEAKEKMPGFVVKSGVDPHDNKLQ